MAQQPLDGVDVDAGFEQVRGKRVTQPMNPARRFAVWYARCKPDGSIGCGRLPEGNSHVAGRATFQYARNASSRHADSTV